MTVNTRDRIKDAALPLFAERGYAGTSIAAIEAAAGLAPRAGTFYRHFESKQALFEELARERITETPDEFDLDGLAAFGDTRAELITLARQFERAGQRQRPYLRLIEEVRLTEAGQAFEVEANQAMFEALMGWIATKPAARDLTHPELAALTCNVFGAWLFYLTKLQQGIHFAAVDHATLCQSWVDHWARTLDEPPTSER